MERLCSRTFSWAGCFILSLLFVTTAQADIKKTGDCKFADRGRQYLCAHTHEHEDDDTDTNTQRGNEAGIGADIVMWKSEKDDSFLEEIVTEYRYDAQNENHKVYGVARLNLWEKIKKFFTKGE